MEKVPGNHTGEQALSVSIILDNHALKLTRRDLNKSSRSRKDFMKDKNHPDTNRAEIACLKIYFYDFFMPLRLRSQMTAPSPVRHR